MQLLIMANMSLLDRRKSISFLINPFNKEWRWLSVDVKIAEDKCPAACQRGVDHESVLN